MEQNDAPEVQSNLIDLAAPKPRRTKKAAVTKRKTTAKVEEAPPIVHSFHLVAFPNDTSSGEQIDTERLTAALSSIGAATISISPPPRFINQFTRTTHGIKVLPIPSATTPIIFKMRDSYTDTLINSLDYVAESSKFFQLYGIKVKRSRFTGEICQVIIFHGVSFKSFTYVGGINLEKNETQLLEVVTSCNGLFEATTADIPNLQKYISERFSI